MGDDVANWEVFERIPPKDGLQANREATLPSGVSDGGGRTAGGGDLYLLPP